MATLAAAWTNNLLDQGLSGDSAMTGGYHAGFLLTAAMALTGAIAALILTRGTATEHPD